MSMDLLDGAGKQTGNSDLVNCKFGDLTSGSLLKQALVLSSQKKIYVVELITEIKHF